MRQTSLIGKYIHILYGDQSEIITVLLPLLRNHLYQEIYIYNTLIQGILDKFKCVAVFDEKNFSF